MDSNLDKIANRVKKLMALANDPAASDGERDNALRMAHATMLKYNLDQTDVDGKPVGPQEARHERSVEGYGRPWAVHLANEVAGVFFCKLLLRRSATKDHTFYCFIGKESNTDAAAEVALTLINSIFREAKRRMRQQGENVTWRRSFCTGAAFKIQERCGALKTSTALEGGATTTALVVRNAYQVETQANEQWLMEQGVRVRASKVRAKSSFDGSAYGQGRAFGDSVSLTPNRKLGY